MLNKEMKDSGVEWIGEVPEDWEVIRLKFLSDISTGNSDTKDRVENGRYPFFVRSQKVESLNEYTHDGEAILTAGDGAGVGRVFHFYNGKFAAHQRVYIFNEFSNKVISKYLFYYIQNNLNKVVSLGGAKSTVDSVRMPMLQNFTVVLPSLIKQKYIVKTLDKLSRNIKMLISETNRSITELKEYKKSILTEVVAKGLNPNVEMIECKIEWIEQIPYNWKVIKGKFLFSKMERDIVVNETVTAFRDGQVVQRKKRRTTGFTNALKEIGYQGVKKGDLVIHSMDAFAGAIGVSEDDGKCTPAYIVLDKQFDDISNEYYTYLLRAYAELGYIESMAKGIRVRSTDYKYQTFANTLFLVPPFEEQINIVRYIKSQTHSINILIEEKEQVIKELEQYNKSLIYEYVTGKKEV